MGRADHMDNACEFCGFPLLSGASMHERESCRKELMKQRQELLDLRHVVKAAIKQIKEELDRGYVLTEEPGAGPAWRRRWGNLLGKLEGAILYPR